MLLRRGLDCRWWFLQSLRGLTNDSLTLSWQNHTWQLPNQPSWRWKKNTIWICTLMGDKKKNPMLKKKKEALRAKKIHWNKKSKNMNSHIQQESLFRIRPLQINLNKFTLLRTTSSVRKWESRHKLAKK